MRESFQNFERSAATAARIWSNASIGRAVGIGGRLEHQRRHRADQDGFGDALRPVPADVASDLAASGRVPDMDRVLQVELLDELSQVVRVGVHVVSLPRLARPAVAASVVGDAAIPLRRQKEHLVLEGVARERPAVAEDDRLSGAPVLVIDLRAVFGGNGAHGSPFQDCANRTKRVRFGLNARNFCRSA